LILRSVTILVASFYWLKYTFGPYFCCFYSILSLFSFCVQLDPHFRQIVINLVLFTNSV